MTDATTLGLAVLGRASLTGSVLAVDVLAAAAPWPAVQHAAHLSVLPVAGLVLAGQVGRALAAVWDWIRRGGSITLQVAHPIGPGESDLSPPEAPVAESLSGRRGSTRGPRHR